MSKNWKQKVDRAATLKNDRTNLVAAFIAQHPGCTQKQIGKALGIPSTGVGKACQALEHIELLNVAANVPKQYFWDPYCPPYIEKEVEKQRDRVIRVVVEITS